MYRCTATAASRNRPKTQWNSTLRGGGRDWYTPDQLVWHTPEDIDVKPSTSAATEPPQSPADIR